MSQYRLGQGPYGSAYNGTIDDILASEDIALLEGFGRSFGLFLGQYPWTQIVTHRYPATQWAVHSKSPADEWERSTEELGQVLDLRFTGDMHHLIVAGTGAGKFRDALANMLLYDGSCETSCLIIDPKGEIASATGPIIDGSDTVEPRTIVLDPWNISGAGFTHALTLLDSINASNLHCVKDTRVLADAIIVQRSEDDGHWVETAKNFLTALLLYLGTSPLESDERHLLRLRQIVTLAWSDLSDLLGHMTDIKDFGGIVARGAQAMLNRDEKERRSILSTIERDTAFLEDPNLWVAIRRSTFDINELVVSNKRLHVIVPFDYTKEMRSWLRLTIAAYYNACLRNRLDPAFPRFLQFRHIIMDEFAGLGPLDFIVKDFAEARGAGVKYHVVVQNFGQLKQHYKEGWQTFVANSFIQSFGINDVDTSEYLSKMTGQGTVITETKSRSESFSTTEGSSVGETQSEQRGISETQSRQFGESRTVGQNFADSTNINLSGGFGIQRGASTGMNSGNSTSSGLTIGRTETLNFTTGRTTTFNTSQTSGHSTSNSFSTTGRPILMPDEVRRLPQSQQLLFLRGMPVVQALRAPYFERFKEFLPARPLKDILAAQRRQIELGALKISPLSLTDLQNRSRRALVNSIPKTSTFRPPTPRAFAIPAKPTLQQISQAIPVIPTSTVILLFYVALFVTLCALDVLFLYSFGLLGAGLVTAPLSARFAGHVGKNIEVVLSSIFFASAIFSGCYFMALITFWFLGDNKAAIVSALTLIGSAVYATNTWDSDQT